MKAIAGGYIFHQKKFHADKVLLFDEKIEKIVESGTVLPEGTEVIEADGRYVIPGMIDVHIHGYGGVDTMDGTIASLTTMAKRLPENGVTSFLATTMTMPIPVIRKALATVRDYMADDQLNNQGAEIVGVHLEGPFINVNKKGAQKAEDIIESNEQVIAGYEEIIKVITIAPEIPANMAFIKKYANRFNFSVGHTDGDYRSTVDAFEAGARSVTHLFNAMTGIHHRKPGVAGAALTADCYAELIADTIHVNKKLFPLIYRSKGKERVLLITDAIRGAGLDEGNYDLGGQEVMLKDGCCLLKDGTLAGSALKLNEGLRHFTENTTGRLEDVLAAATLTPATYIGIDKQRGSLDIGKYADVVIMDKDYQVSKTFVKGELKYADKL